MFQLGMSIIGLVRVLGQTMSSLVVASNFSKGRIGTFIRPKTAALGQMGLVLWKRKIVQMKSRVSADYLERLPDKHSLFQHRAMVI